MNANFNISLQIETISQTVIAPKRAGILNSGMHLHKYLFNICVYRYKCQNVIDLTNKAELHKQQGLISGDYIEALSLSTFSSSDVDAFKSFFNAMEHLASLKSSSEPA